MQLQRAFPGVEYPAEVMAEMPGDVLDGDFRHQVEVEFRAQPGQPPGQDLGPLVRSQAVQISGEAAVGERGQVRLVVPGRRGEAAADDAGLQAGVQLRGDDGFLGAAHDDQLVDEVVSWPAPAAHLLAQGQLLSRCQRLDDQHLEVGPGRAGPVAVSSGPTSSCSSMTDHAAPAR